MSGQCAPRSLLFFCASISHADLQYNAPGFIQSLRCFDNLRHVWCSCLTAVLHLQ